MQIIRVDGYQFPQARIHPQTIVRARCALPGKEEFAGELGIRSRSGSLTPIKAAPSGEGKIPFDYPYRNHVSTGDLHHAD
jgi:hypothetical protein